MSAQLRIALLSHPPNYCPHCGHNLTSTARDPNNLKDFLAGMSLRCPECLIHIQHVPSTALKQTASQYGDLTRYL
jgi:hypothetical protein